jgi:type II secretory pathway pseudopilin PulG
MKHQSEAGFTIAELAISVTVAGFLAAAIFIATFYYYVNVSQSQATTELALESQAILSQLSDDIRLSDAISSTNLISDANAPAGGWHTSDPSNVLIVESPAIDSSRNILYDSTTGYPYRNEFVYFLNGKVMHKRILANPAAVGNAAKTSCPSNMASSSCPEDRVLSNDSNNLHFTFYDSQNSTTADATLARSVSLQADMLRKVFGKNITLNNSTQITLRNQ